MKRDSKGGFTLVELIVVIGFLGLLFSIVLPRIDKSPYILLYSAKTLRDDIRCIRYTAMTENPGARIVLDKYSYKILNGTKIVSTVNLNNGFYIKQNFSRSSIAFDYKGTPVHGGGTVSIVDENSKKYCEITVVPDTGRILMKDTILKGYNSK
ncbi:MAG: hypothetical protein M0P77_02180 [Firmicutes bacterium]|nr:hypothetical protein [Bacillota bacterium]